MMMIRGDVCSQHKIVDHYDEFTINIIVIIIKIITIVIIIIIIIPLLKVTVVIGRPRVISPAVSTEEWEVSRSQDIRKYKHKYKFKMQMQTQIQI